MSGWVAVIWGWEKDIWFGLRQIRKAGNYNTRSVINNKIIVHETNESYFFKNSTKIKGRISYDIFN